MSIEGIDGSLESRTVRVQTLEADGTWTETTFEMPDDLVETLARARARWQELREAGTPYWCIHEDRSVTHPEAFPWDDHPEDPIYRKHGVRCAECGGYIQEG